MYSFVTSFSPAGWNLYARTFVESFADLMPPEVTLLAYWEGSRPCYDGLLPGYNLLELEPCASFLARHRGNKIVHGREAADTHPWAPKAKREKYSYRHDGYKFARKVFAVADAARRMGRGRLYWIDADVVVTKKVPLRFLRSLLPDDTSLSFLSRPRSYSELGFVGYNLDILETHAFLAAYEAEYSEDVFMRRQFWTDCHIFDYLVKDLRPAVYRIPHTSDAQPFDFSPVGQFMTHLKGMRKIQE